MSQLPSINGVTPAEHSTETLPSYVPVNGCTQPLPTTHTTALSAYHIKVEDFVDRLRASVENFFPNNKYRYKEVHVLLLSWEDDDLGVVDEVVELEDVFRKAYGCQTVRRWEIPSLKPYSKLEDQLYRFRKKYSSSDNLLIVYYAGHGYLDYSRLWKWAAYRYVLPLKPSQDEDDQAERVCSDAYNKPPSPTLDWYALQSGLEHAESDVLILLDSCASAGSSGGSKQFEIQEGGTTELLAACGFETSAPGPGPHSFTNALIKELRDLSTLDFPFAVTMLHQRIVARLVDYSPQYSSVVPFVSVLGSGQSPPERRATPVYISLGRDFRQKSIPLRSYHSTHNSGGRSTASSGSTEQSKAGDTDDSQRNRTASAIKRLLGDDNAPKVLLAINLHGEHWQNLEHTFVDWLKDMPVLAASINIEAIFHGLSTMILLSMPIAVWDLFPEHPSCSFVGFVRSSNLLPSPMSLLCSKQEDSAYTNNTIGKFDLWLHTFKMNFVLERTSNARLAQKVSLIPKTGIWPLLASLALSLILLIPFSGYEYYTTRSAWYYSPIYRDSMIAHGGYFTTRSESYYSPVCWDSMIAHVGKPSPCSNAGGLALVTSVGSDTYEVSRSCLLVISLWVLTVFHLNATERLRFREFGASFQKYWKRGLWSVMRTLTLMLCHTFWIAIIDVIDAGLSANGLRKYAHVDGVRWTLTHTRYAAMGGFVVQPPVTATTKAFGGHQRPISLSPRELLQARQSGYLKKLPDVDITQRWWTSNTWTGRLLVFRVAWFLIQSFIRWRKCISITPLEIIACVFGTYTVMTYVVLDNLIFSYRLPTLLSLRAKERFWSRIEDEDNLLLPHDPRTRSGSAYIDDSFPRHRRNYHIGPVRFWVGLIAGSLISDVLQAIAWDETSPTPTRSTSITAHPLFTGVSVAMIMLEILLEKPYGIRLSDWTKGVLAKVDLGVVIFLTYLAASPNFASLVFVAVFLSVFVAENSSKTLGTA